MEFVREFIDSDSLSSIIRLPESLRNRRLEIIVLPAESKTSSKETVDVDGIVASLTGCIPDPGMTLEEYREERLNRYETVD